MPDGDVITEKTIIKKNGINLKLDNEFEILKLIRKVFLKELNVKSFKEYNEPDVYGRCFDAVDWINSNFHLFYGKNNEQQRLSYLFSKYSDLSL
jgi:hypothetical protein